MTRRERLEAKIEKRREWAAKRDAKVSSVVAQQERYRGDIAFNTQPGHIPERARLIRREEKAFGSGGDYETARYHERKASGLERQLERTVFSDDADAIEKLEARIAEHEAERERMKKVNRLYKKGDAAGLAEMGLNLATLRSVVEAPNNWHKVPHPGYELANLGARIRTDKERIETIKARAARTEKARASGGVLVEGDGRHVRVTFEEKPSREILTALKAAGFYWNGGSWNGERVKLAVVASRPDWPEWGRPTDEAGPGYETGSTVESVMGSERSSPPPLSERDPEPECGHPWAMHKRAANGAQACSSFGCGCRDVVLPLELELPS